VDDWVDPVVLAERVTAVGPPMHYDQVRPALYPDTAELEDFSYERVARLLRLVRGEPATARQPAPSRTAP
jgi:hypothetical protein